MSLRLFISIHCSRLVMMSGIFWTVKLLVPSSSTLLGDVAVEPLGDGHHRDHRGDADQDAEHGQERAQLVRAQRGERRCATALSEGHGQVPAAPLLASLTVRSSLSIWPSRMWIVRWACSAMSRSCVTRMMVLPSLVQPLEQPHDLLAGGGVEVAGGLVRQQDATGCITSARAMATRWRWPPESSLGRWLHAVAQLHHLQRLARALQPLLLGDAGVDQRQLDVVQRGGARQQVEGLEDEADLAVADRGQLVVVHLGDDLAAQDVACPRMGVSRQPMMFMSVDLPEPDGPMTATYSPVGDLEA